MINLKIGHFKITTRELKDHIYEYRTTITDQITKKKVTFETESESGAAYIMVLFLRDHTCKEGKLTHIKVSEDRTV